VRGLGRDRHEKSFGCKVRSWNCCHIRNCRQPDMLAPESWLGDGESAGTRQAPRRPPLRSPPTSQSLPFQGWTVQTMPAMVQPRGRSMRHRLLMQHLPWNKGKLVGQKAPLKLKEIWAVRIRLQMAQRVCPLLVKRIRMVFIFCLDFSSADFATAR
jgi:hypothetical protein